MKGLPRQHHRSAPVLGRSNVPPCMVAELFQTAVRPSPGCVRSAVVLDRSNVRTGLFPRISPIHSDRSFLLFIDCGFGQHALNRWAIVDRPCGTGTAHVASNPSSIARGRAHSDSHSLGGGSAEMHWRHSP